MVELVSAALAPVWNEKRAAKPEARGTNDWRSLTIRRFAESVNHLLFEEFDSAPLESACTKPLPLACCLCERLDATGLLLDDDAEFRFEPAATC